MTAEMPAIGIDFGACRSSAAVLIGGEPRSVVLSSDQARDMQTAIYVETDGQILVGEDAAGARTRDTTRYRDRFKLGIAKDRGVSVAVDGANRSVAWVDLVAAVLRRCRLRAQAQFNNDRPLTDAIVTVPALYVEREAEWKVMEQAAHAAGFATVQIAREPYAAAIYYDHVLRRAGQTAGDDGKIALVYDLGGGTFDPALIRRRAGSYELVGAGVCEGGIACGGLQFDQAIRTDFAHKCPEAWQRLRPAADRAMVADAGIARRRAREIGDLDAFLIRVKHRFASPDVREVNDVEPITGRDYHLTRAEFYALIEPLLDRTIDSCRLLVQRAGVAWRDISRILMVGGSCHIPLVRDKLQALVRAEGASTEICWQRIGDTDQLVDPHLAVSLGAALVHEHRAEPARVSPQQPQPQPQPQPPPQPAPPHAQPRPAPPRAQSPLLQSPPPRSSPSLLQPGQKYCQSCATVLDERAELCPRCRTMQSPAAPTQIAAQTTALVTQPARSLVRSTKDRTTAAVLALLLGGLGAHRFYLGQTGIGIVYLLLCWTLIPSMIAFVEGILLLTMSDQRFAERHS